MLKVVLPDEFQRVMDKLTLSSGLKSKSLYERDMPVSPEALKLIGDLEETETLFLQSGLNRARAQGNSHQQVPQPPPLRARQRSGTATRP